MNPKSMTGTGQASLTVNTTPPHPSISKRTGAPGWLAAGGGASFACVFLLALPRRRWRGKAMFVLTFMAILFTAIGCGGTAQTDPGTTQGYLHRCGHSYGRQRVIARPDQRERSDHNPVRTNGKRRDQEKSMLMNVWRLAGKLARTLCVIGVLSAALVWASVGGSISGTVKDPSGRVIPNAEVTSASRTQGSPTRHAPTTRAITPSRFCRSVITSCRCRLPAFRLSAYRHGARYQRGAHARCVARRSATSRKR